MSSVNNTGFRPSSLVLIGFPGLEYVHIWLAAPLSTIYIMTLLGNLTLLLVIKTVLSLHKPMYFYISQLAFTDLSLSSSVFPKLLDILWFNAEEISFNACLIQLFFISFFLALESSIFLSMAFDRYVALCHPLRYTTILTNSLMIKITVVCLLRAAVLIPPIPLLIFRLSFCSRHISHSFCENMAVAKLSCGDITVNSVYVMTLTLYIAFTDIFGISLSYVLILRAILHLPLNGFCKAFSKCSTHICAMLIFYLAVLCSLTLHRLRENFPLYVQVIAANTYIRFPPFINPLIFGVTMKEVQKGVHTLVQRIKMLL